MHKEHKQRLAVARLKKALDACADAGLMGGVYDGAFWWWPADTADPRDHGPGNFFSNIRAVGGDSIYTHMNLDGGAGV